MSEDSGMWVKVYPEYAAPEKPDLSDVGWATVGEINGTFTEHEYSDADGEWVAFKFTDNGDFETLTDGLVGALLIGGGGGGGTGGGAGGGAGGYIKDAVALFRGSQSVDIGKGGGSKNNGHPTRLGTLIAFGGGAGGPYASNIGQDGGSGGGSGSGWGGGQPNRSNSIFGQGHRGGPGGDGNAGGSAGGGGGAGADSTNKTGGAGIDISEFIGEASGTLRVGGGGGGGSRAGRPTGSATDGGGNGSGSGGRPGTANTGGGGGGAGETGGGGTGGSGLAIVRFPKANVITTKRNYFEWLNFSVVENGVVSDIVRMPSNKPVTLDSDWIATPYEVEIGWSYENGNFVAPEIPEASE